jgi:hypothetical protein
MNETETERAARARHYREVAEKHRSLAIVAKDDEEASRRRSLAKLYEDMARDAEAVR